MRLGLHPVGKRLRLFPESLQQQTGRILRSHYLRTFGVDFAVAHPDLVDAIHQLGDQIKMEPGAAKGLNPALRRQDHLRVFEGILEAVGVHSGYAQDTRGPDLRQ